ncbi:hypothetical protein [Nocardia jejuensis]|uniref:hypothetical protein n=1 Tax=Nocardia jejuensis TaxID=328049 RepID=UPI00083314F9|nr:hypothetical protein [Nocardia jejuensis]
MSVDSTLEVHQQVPLPSLDEARELTENIRRGVEQVWALVTHAYACRVWTVLEYDSWDAYCSVEFDGARLRIPREERSQVVESLRESGMSTRAIAAATGLGYGTVQRGIAELSGDPNGSRDSVVGLDGKQYQPKPVDRDTITVPDSAEEQSDQDEAPASPRRRRPLTDSFDTARADLLKKTDALARIAADERFERHADQLAHRFRSDLLRARDALQAVIDRLPDSSDRPEEG